MEPLFVDSTLEFEKISAEVTLPEDPNQWPTEILQELYKQVPYISDFDPDVIMDRVDAERRYGFGHVEVSNKTEIQEAPEHAVSQAAGIRHVRIPIIIKEGKLQPFDIIVTDQSKMVPLTERRLRQSLFRPQLFDVTSRTPGDQSMISQLYPPYRQNYGFGGGGSVMTAGMGKEGQKTGSVLAAILPTINTSDYEKFAKEVATPLMKAAFYANRAGMQPSIEVLSKFEPKNLATRGEKIAAAMKPSVVQITHHDGSGYTLKTASSFLWAPTERDIDRGELVKLVGVEVALEIDKHGSVTMGEEAEMESDLPENDNPELIKDYGIYKVQDSDGRHLIGFCFPNLLDTDGEPMPLTLFTNGSQAAVQGEVVGVKVSEGAALFEGRPRGHGVFYKVLPNGKAVATVPLDLSASVSGEAMDGMTLVGEDMNGMELHVQIQPGLAKITKSDETTMLVPDDWSWLPLDKAEPVVLADQPDVFDKVAQKVDKSLAIELRAGGPSTFSISGGPVDKLAHDEKQFLGIDDTLFLLAGVGIAPGYGIQKMGEAVQFHQPIRIFATKSIQPAEEAHQQMYEKAASMLERMPVRKFFVKEAAAIPDPTAVDTVLSLGFINPENVLTFISYIPVLDEAQSKLCELLVSARLGAQDIPTSALERTVRGLEETLEGLHTLAFQNN